MRQLGIRFKAVPSDFDESGVRALNPRAYTMKLAELKAGKVASRFRSAIVVGTDTVIVFKGKIFGKPRGKADAVRTLSMLNGRTHAVVSGVCVMDTHTGRKLTRSASTRVTFRNLSRSAIQAYVDSGEALGKAGSYAIQGRGAALVKEIRGDFYNVVGLPVPLLLDMLDEIRK